MPLTIFDIGAFLLILAAAFGLINDRWIGMPRNIALLIGAILVAGLLMATDLIRPDGPVTESWRERLHHAHLSAVLLDGVLPLLLFANALEVDPREMRDRAWTVLVLATLGVIISAALFGYGLYWLTVAFGHPIPLVWCLVLGAILAPTDAVIVQGLLRQARIPANLRGMIAGESLFNDAAAVVLFLAGLAFAAGDHQVIGHGHLALRIVEQVLGAGLLGWSAGLLAVFLCRGIKDHTLELTLSLALALGTYRLAAWIGISGPIAVVAAGLAWRHLPRRPRERDDQTMVSWRVIDDFLNTWLFLLMGFQVLVIRPTIWSWAMLPLVLLLALLSRGASVAAPIVGSRMAGTDKLKCMCVLTWAGLRGGISIALALTLPETPWRDTLLALGYAVVILSIVVQGLSVGTLVRTLYSRTSEAPHNRHRGGA